MPTKKAKPRKTVGAGSSSAMAKERKKLFIEAMIANGSNATQAAISAGYSVKTAGSQGQRLTKDPDVKAALEARQAALATKYELTAESVIAELSKIVHSDVRHVLNDNGSLKPVTEWPEHMSSVIAGIDIVETTDEEGSTIRTKKIKLYDKNSAIEKAMKHLGLFAADNKQKDPLDGIPRDMLKSIVEKLKQG